MKGVRELLWFGNISGVITFSYKGITWWFHETFRKFWWEVLCTGRRFWRSSLCDVKHHQKPRYLKFKMQGKTSVIAELFSVFKILNLSNVLVLGITENCLSIYLSLYVLKFWTLLFLELGRYWQMKCIVCHSNNFRSITFQSNPCKKKMFCHIHIILILLQYALTPFILIWGKMETFHNHLNKKTFLYIIWTGMWL